MTAEQMLAQSADEYMNAGQVAFFKRLLIEKQALLRERISRNQSACRFERQPDESDMGANETTLSTTTRLIEFDMNSLRAVAKALTLIDSGEYGYCTATGAEIGLRRLLVVPESTLSLYSMECLERAAMHKRVA